MSLSTIRSIFNTDKGASFSNEYEVTFDMGTSANLLANLSEVGFTSFGTATAFENMMFLCDEASIPGTFAATNEIDGMYTGRLIQFPHGKLYNDLTLGFMLTNQVNPVKFFEAWMYTIFPERKLNTNDNDSANINGPIPYDSKTVGSRGSRTNVTTLEYYDSIVCNSITITKSFKTRTSEKGGKSSITRIYKAYPYSVETVPLSYGPSVINKLRVQFRYEKHVTTFY